MVDNVHLPKVFALDLQERLHRQATGLADAFFEVMQFFKLFPGTLSYRQLEAVLPCDQGCLCTNGKFRINPQIAEHVDHDRAFKFAAQVFEELTDFRFGELPGINHFDQVGIGVEIELQPVVQCF